MSDQSVVHGRDTTRACRANARRPRAAHAQRAENAVEKKARANSADANADATRVELRTPAQDRTSRQLPLLKTRRTARIGSKNDGARAVCMGKQSMDRRPGFERFF
jgi:hypothetical protein